VSDWLEGLADLIWHYPWTTAYILAVITLALIVTALDKAL